MPSLSVQLQAQRKQIDYTPGASLRDLLDEHDCRVRTACVGHGACGLCRVRIDAGEVPNPTLAEQFHISQEDLQRGERLACQVYPRGDCCLTVLNPAPPSVWLSLPASAAPQDIAFRPHAGIPDDVHHPLGAAVDIGTTHIRAALVDLRHGRWLIHCRGPNPQAQLGADVVTRLSEAVSGKARRLRALVAGAIGEALLEMAQRDGLDLRRVVQVDLVGNTAMLTLLGGQNQDLLLQPQYWEKAVPCPLAVPEELVRAWNIHPRAHLELVQPFAGFIGSDFLAGLLATQLGAEAPALFIDLGTNSEMAIWNGEQLWVTAAAGGPAFEVGGFSCGMPADDGAIYRVTATDDGDFAYRVIGGRAPLGVCGSGLVDWITCLLETRCLGPIGRFKNDDGSQQHMLDSGERKLILRLADVDALQRAKAAIGCGIRKLAAAAGVGLGDFRRVCVAGEFGRYLDIANAQAIGLLPTVPVSRVELCGDTALFGCASLLLDSEAQERLSRILAAARVINLALVPDFEELYIDSLYLRPLQEL